MKLLISIALIIGLTGFNSNAADYYWIAGTGSWSQTAHWSLTSGGVAAATIPTSADNVIFDASSGLASTNDTVYLDIAPSVVGFNFANVSNGFVFSGSVATITISGSLTSNGLAVFNWNGIFHMNPTSNSTLTSAGHIWNNEFQFNGLNTVQLIDDFRLTKNVLLNQGTLQLAGNYMECENFYSESATSRTLNITNSILAITNDTLSITSPSFTLNGIDSRVNIESPGSFYFNGGNGHFDSIVVASNIISMYGNDTVNFFSVLPGTTINIDNDKTLSLDVFSSNASCSNGVNINSINGAGTSANVLYIGSSTFSATNLQINNVDALAPPLGSYAISLSDTTNGSDGWFFAPANFYWIGNTGNWNDPAHWSASSGGTSLGCIPSQFDNAIFDLNSFNSAGAVVTTNIPVSIYTMTWLTATNNPTLKLQNNIICYDDVTLNAGLIIDTVGFNKRMELRGNADFNPLGALIKSNVSINCLNNADTIALQSHLHIGSKSNLFLGKGKLVLNDNFVESGTIITTIFDTINDTRHLNMGNSTVDLAIGFFAANETGNFTLNSGNSHLKIVDTSGTLRNYIFTEGLNFYDVTLDLKSADTTQPITGNNTFHKLHILPKTSVDFEAGTTQTITDSLIVIGTCKDSIFMKSMSTTIQADISMSNANRAKLECIEMNGIDASNAALTSYYSLNNGNNSNITFSTTTATNASFTSSGPFCFGDTTLFNNTSTAVSGNTDDITSKWFFNDGSTGYFQTFLNAQGNLDSTFVNYEIDTLQHAFEVSGDILVTLVTSYTNFCTDTFQTTIHINNAAFQLSTSQPDTTICAGENVVFETNALTSGMLFEFFLNGSSLNTPSAIDTILTTSTLVQNDIIGAIAYENGCESEIQSFQYVVNPLPIYNWGSSDSDTSICQLDMVSFFGNSTPDTTNSFRFLRNGTGVTGFQLNTGVWSSSALNDNDVISIIAKTNKNCVDTSFMTFNVDPLPTTGLSSSIAGSVICAGQQVDFTASGATEYEFFVDNISQGAPSTTNTYSTTSLTNGQVVKVIGYLGTGCSKQATQTYSYTVNPLPNVTLVSSDSDLEICSGMNIQFNASGAALYTFYINGVAQGPASSTSIFSTSTLADGDEVSVLGNFSGCSAETAPMVFDVNATPSVTFTSSDPDDIICSGTTVLFTATGATNYEFFINGNSQGAPSTTNTFSTSTIADNESVGVIAESNGCEVSSIITFTVNSTPFVNIFSNDGDNSICEGENITFTGTNGNQYELFVNGVSQGAPQVSPTFVPTLPNGTNSVYVVGTALNGCTDTSAVISNVIVTPLPNVVISSSDLDNIICANTPVTFTGTGSSQYQFFIDGLPVGSMSATNQFTTSNLTNNQVVSITGSTNGCFNAGNSIAFTVNPIPSVSLSSTDVDNVFCDDATVVFTANGATNYEFFVNGISQGPSSPMNSINSSGFATGIIPIQVIGTSNGCSNSFSTNITNGAVPTANLISNDADNTICAGNSISFTASGGTLYQFSINGIAQGGYSPSTVFNISTLSNSDYIEVTAQSSNGCQDVSNQIAITVNPVPVVSLASSDADQSICVNDLIDFTGSGATNYEFFVNGVSQGLSSSNPNYSNASLQNGDEITVIGTQTGCSSSSNSLVFNVYSYPVVNLINNGTLDVCTGENLDLLATGASNYQFLVNGIPVGPFSSINTFNTAVLNGDLVSVIGENFGCESTGLNDYTFSVNTYPSITVNSSDLDNIICIDDLVEFDASGASTYAYSLNGIELQNGVSSSFEISTLEQGDVISIIGYNGDCASTSSNFNFTVNSMNLDLVANPSNFICEGENVTFTASGGNEYLFFVNGIAQGSMSTNNTFSSSTFLDSDEVSFTALSTSTNCTQTNPNTIILNVVEQPQVTFSTNTTFCEGDSVILYSNSEYGNQWLLNGNPIVGAIDTSIVVFASGNYSLETTLGGLGDIWSVGQNAAGMFGNGTNFNSSELEMATLSASFDQISSGLEFILGKTATGALYSWGKNSSGQLGLGNYTNYNVPQLVAGATNIKTIATSDASAMAVTTTGNVLVWGNNAVGQLGTGNTSVINFPFQNPSLTNVDSIAAGKTHFVILKNDGTVWTVGSNDYGQLGNGTLNGTMLATQITGLTNIVSVGAGEYSSFAMDVSGDLFVWGNNGSGQLGLNDLNNRLIPTPSSLKKVKQAIGGANHAIFLTEEKKVFASGGNAYGQLGNGTTTPSLVPLELSINNVSRLASGQYTTLILREDNIVFACGNNAENQLTNTGTMITTPIQIDADGVTFIEGSNGATHFIFGTENTCSSTSTSATMLTAPDVTISESSDILTASEAGVSYQWYLYGNPAVLGTQQSFATSVPGIYFVVVTFANGCSSQSSVYNHYVVGIDSKEALSYNVYPNPATTQLTIKSNSNELKKIKIYDNAGRTVYEHEPTPNSEITIQIDHLLEGMYWLELESENQKVTSKFIKTL